MRVIPPTVTGMTDSRAERRLHDLFSVVDLPGWTAVHSLNLAAHPYKRWGEIDFVIVSPSGVLVLEVKGGRVARSADGVWEFTDRYDVIRRKVEGPFRQAASAQIALQRWVEGQLPSSDAGSIVWGYGAAFPDIRFHETSPEWSVEMVGDRESFHDATATRRWLTRLAAYWQTRTRRPEPLSSKIADVIVRLVRGEFEHVPSLATRGRQVVEASNRLTEQQTWLLDLVPANPRILVEGGAGTGKTFMAAEVARREATRISSPDDPGIVVVVPRRNAGLPFAGVLPSGVRVVTPDTWATAHPGSFLVADEAQDLLSEEGLVTLDRLVVGGLDHGRWVLFFDPNEQARFRGVFDLSALEVVRGTAPAHVPLGRNLRNTFEIVRTVQDVTRADIGVPGGGHGPDAEVEVIARESDFVSASRRILGRLAGQQVGADEVAVITWLDPAVVALALDGRPYPTVALSDGAGPDEVAGRLACSTPADFQGLEATYVILGPVPAPDDPVAIAGLYVAATRARAGLWYVATAESAERLAARARPETASTARAQL